MRPPERIDAGQVALTRWDAAWAVELVAAVRASLAELQPFMAWAHDGFSVDSAQAFIARSIADWAAGTEFNYAVHARSGELVGSAGLMTRMGPGILEVGYWIHSAQTGRGWATAAATALAGTALSLEGVGRVAIRHDVANLASARVAQRAGFTETERRPSTLAMAPGMAGTEVVWERARAC